MNVTRNSLVQGLREAANWLELHPEFDLGANCDPKINMDLCWSPDDVARLKAAMVNVEEMPLGEDYWKISTQFGPVQIWSAVNRHVVASIELAEGAQ